MMNIHFTFPSVAVLTTDYIMQEDFEQIIKLLWGTPIN